MKFICKILFFSDDENEEGSEEDIEVEAEIEERDPVVCRPDEVAGLKLLSTRNVISKVPYI